MSWLIEHPPIRDQFRTTRREEESGVVVIHTAENTPDTVATDGGAEAVAEFIRTRITPGSYHTLADSDSRLQLLSWTFEAYQDGTGSNRHAVGLAVATRADWWPWAPKAWRDGAIEQLAQAAAEYAFWLYEKRGIVIPARRITRAESEARIPGFISHGDRDPDRRSDPGAFFPWNQFLVRYAELTASLSPTPVPSEEDDFMVIITAPNRPPRLYGHGGTFVPVSKATADNARLGGTRSVHLATNEYDKLLSQVIALLHDPDVVEAIGGISDSDDPTT